MTDQQFHALTMWIKAEIEARAVKHSAGPHVSEIRRAAEQRRVEAKALLAEQ